MSVFWYNGNLSAKWQKLKNKGTLISLTFKVFVQIKELAIRRPNGQNTNINLAWKSKVPFSFDFWPFVQDMAILLNLVQ